MYRYRARYRVQVRKQMKKKIFFVVSAVTIISAVLVFIAGIFAVSISSGSAVNERLISETQLAAALISDEEDFKKLDAYKNAGSFRVTIIAADGTVLYESDSTAELENHSERSEFIAALNGRPEVTERYSSTLGYKMNYYAVTCTLNDGQTVVIRLAARNSLINGYVNLSLPVFILLVLIILGLAFEASGRIAAKISGRIQEISDSVKSVANGSYVPVKADSRDPELYSVINNINDLNASISRHIASEENQRKKLGAVLGNVSQGIIAVNDNKETVFINKSAVKILGDKSSVNYGTDTGKDLLYFIDDLGLYGKLSSHMNSDCRFEYRLGEKDLDVTVKTVDDKKLREEIAAIIIISDVTTEKSVARQKSEFFANASHELKTPITVIQGLTEVLLQKGGLDEFTEKKLQSVHKECLRLGSIIADMLKLSRLENDAFADVETEKTDLTRVAAEVISEIKPKSDEKSISVTLTGNASAQISQKNAFELLSNIIGNAVNYNVENGKIDVNLSENDDESTLRVADTGIGIEKEHLPRLCERFYRVDKSRSKKTGGTGLGLAIVKHVCIACGAKLSIESVFGEGTSVTVTFPKHSGTDIEPDNSAPGKNS